MSGYDPNVPRIEDEIADIWSDVPESDWRKLPADLSENLDEYLYGTEWKCRLHFNDGSR